MSRAIIEPMYKVLCSKDGVLLKYKRHSPEDLVQDPTLKNTFLIDFEVHNQSPSINLQQFCTYNIFRLIFEVNRADAIEDLKLDERPNSSEAEMVLVFKRKGEDFGMKQKFMHLNISLSTVPIDGTDGMTYVFECEPAYGYDCAKPMEQIHDASAVFCMSLLSPDAMRVQFMLNIPVPKVEQASYIENSLGFIMKKILARTKTFIESMK
jgi:hypothetical protein